MLLSVCDGRTIWGGRFLIGWFLFLVWGVGEGRGGDEGGGLDRGSRGGMEGFFYGEVGWKGFIVDGMVASCW